MKIIKTHNYKIAESDIDNEKKYKQWILNVKESVKNAIMYEDLSRNDIYELYDWLKTTYRAGVPDSYFERMVSEITDWYKKGMK